MSYETNDKMVSHPEHYKSGKYEVIDIIDEFTKDLSGTEAVCTANVIKYILRWKKKNGIQDVKKAIWYLQHMVDKEEERLQEEHAEFDEELLNKKLRRIHENSIYGIPKEVKLTMPVDVSRSSEGINKEVKLESGCDKCEISECKFLEDPFMNPPYNELYNSCERYKEEFERIHKKYINSNKMNNELMDKVDSYKKGFEFADAKNAELITINNNQKETIEKLLREKKEMQDSIDILEDDKKKLKDDNNDLKKKLNNIRFVNGLKEANKQLAEDFNKKANNEDIQI